MRVGRSNAQTNKMWDVSIYDLTGGPERKTIYADSGVFSLAPNGQDLQIELFDGYAQEFVRGDSRRLQRSYFRTQMVRKRGISRGFESSRSDNYKGDREMTICEMQRKYAVNAVDFERIRQEYIGFLSRTVTKGTKTVTVPRARPPKDALASFYCSAVASLFRVNTANAQGAPPLELLAGDLATQEPAKQEPVKQEPAKQQPPAPKPTLQPPTKTQPSKAQPVKQQTPRPAGRMVINVGPSGLPETTYVNKGVPAGATPAPTPLPTLPAPSLGTVRPVPDSVAGFAPAPGALPPAVVPGAAGSAVPSTAVPPPNPNASSPASLLPMNVDSVAMFKGAALAATTQLAESRESLDSLSVEIQKKFALSFACVVFVLFGPPIALRFPRGGVGVTIGVSIVVFGLYYICLMGGEALADKGRLPAIVAMWIANFIFSIVGVVLLWRVESTTDTSRGGGIRDWWADRKARAALKAEEAAERNSAKVTA